MAHNNVVAQVTTHARQWESGGKTACLKLLGPYMNDIISNPEAANVLSSAFFVLISRATIAATRQPADVVITADSLNGFALELVRNISSSKSANGHQPPIPGTTLSPQAHKLSEIIVDIIWTIDSELEDPSVEEARAPSDGSATLSTLQTRATSANQQRMADRERLVELIRRLLTGVLDADHCRERLEPILVTAIRALFRQSSTIKQREAKLRTATFYKQTRYNLLREQSEGYSKLVTELYQSVGPAHDASTAEPAETKARLVQRAQETWARIVALVGFFDLDPNRVVDIFLDCFEAHLATHWSFFLELLRCSPWSRAKPQESARAGEATETDVMEYDPEPHWEGLTMDEVLAKAEGLSEVASNSSTPQGSQCGQLLGFKFAYYQSPTVSGNAPPKLYMLAALLLREGFIELSDLYAHLEPADEAMAEFEEQWNTTKPAALTQRSSALAMAAPLIDDSNRGGYRHQGSTSSQAKVSTTDSAPTKDRVNQKARLVHALFCVGALRPGLTILSKFPWFTSAYPDIADALLRLLDLSFEPLYTPVSLAQRSPHYAASNSTARGKWSNAKVVNPITRTMQLTLSVPVPPSTLTTSFTFFYPKWHEWIPRLRTHSHMMTVGVPLLRHVGLLLCRDVTLLTRLCRIGKAQLNASIDPNTKLVDPDLLKDWIDITRLFLLPSLSMQRSNSVLATEIWGLLGHADPTLRWGVYGEWQSGKVFAPRISPYADDEYDPDFETPEEKQERESKEAHARALEAKDSVARDFLKERRAEVARDTRDLMRRITDKNPTMFARLLAKLSHSNPTITFPAIMKQLMAYDNFAKAVVGTSKYLTVMEFDVFTYYLLEAFSDDDRGKVKEDGENTSMWLQSLAAFAGQLCRRHASFESTHILEYMSHQLHNNRYDDLVILRNLISKMTSIDATMDALPDRLLVALRGGPLLQVEMLAPETRGAEGVTPMNQRSTARLLDSLRRTKLLGPMVVLLAKLRQTSAFANAERAKHPKILGLILDECQAVLFQYLELLWTNTTFDEWAAVTPSITDLVDKYGIEFSIAMHILRPKLREAILRASETKGELTEHDSKTGKAPETAEAVERRLKSELKLQSVKKEQAAPAPESAGADATPEPVSESTATSPWNPVLLPIIKEVANLLPERVTETIGAPFFVTFWQLSMYELVVPDASYTSVVTRLSNKIREPIPPSSRDVRFLEDRRKRMQHQVELLPQEMKRQMTAKSLTAARLRREKNFWFPLYPNQNDVASNFVQYCIHPRAVLTPVDADFCSHFLKLLLTIGTSTANCLKFYDQIFAGHISSLIFTCTEREARNYGRFLRGVLADLGAWAKDEKVYKAEIVDKLLPAFMRGWQRSTSPRPIKASDITQWDTFKKIVSKWHVRLYKSCVECLESGEAMHVRNAIIVLTEVLPVFPLKEVSHNSGPAILNAVRQLLEKEARPDLFNMAQSYHGQLNGRRSLWEAEIRDSGVTRALNAAPQAKPATAPSSKAAPSDPTPSGPTIKSTVASSQSAAINGANGVAEPAESSKDVEMASGPSTAQSAPPVSGSTEGQPASTSNAESETKSYVDSLPKPSVVKGRVQRDVSAASTPPPSAREPAPPQSNARPAELPTEPRRPTPNAPRLDIAKLNGSEPAKPPPVAAQLSARSSRPPTPTGPRKHNAVDSPRLGRASMPVPIEPSSTATAQELRKLSAEKSAEKSAAAASSDRTPSRRSSPDGRRSASPRPSRRNGSADSRVSERTRDKGRDRDRDRERYDERERERDKDRDRDRRHSQTYRSSKTRTDRDKDKDKDYRKRSGDGSRVRGHEEDDEGSAKRHKSGGDEKKRDERERHHGDRRDRDKEKERDQDKHRTREKDKDRERDRDRDRDRERDRDRTRPDKDREREKEREPGKEKDKEKDRPRHRERERDRDREKDREREKDKDGERGRSRRGPRGDDTATAEQPTPSGDAPPKPAGDTPAPPKIQPNVAGLPAKPQLSEHDRDPIRDTRDMPRNFEHSRSFDQSFHETSRPGSLASRLSHNQGGPSIPQKRVVAEDPGSRDTDRPAKIQRSRGGYGPNGSHGGGGTFNVAMHEAGMGGRRGDRSGRMNRTDNQ